MKSIKRLRSKALLLMATLLTNFNLLWAQSSASSESVYSDQKYDPAATDAWFNSPLVWAGGMVLVGAVIIMLVRKNRKYT